MSYTFAAVGVVAWLFLAGVVTIVARFVPSVSHAFPWIWRVALWSTAGILLASALFIVIATVGIPLVPPADPKRGIGARVTNFGVAMLLIYGPIVATVIGGVAGGVLGLRLSPRTNSRMKADQ